MICLLLSGDIHPCPGPHHAKPGRGTLLSGHVQQTNLPCFGSPGFGGGVLPALSAVTSGEVVEAQRLGTSIMDRRHTGVTPAQWIPGRIQLPFRYALLVAVCHCLAMLNTLTSLALSWCGERRGRGGRVAGCFHGRSWRSAACPCGIGGV